MSVVAFYSQTQLFVSHAAWTSKLDTLDALDFSGSENVV